MDDILTYSAHREARFFAVMYSLTATRRIEGGGAVIKDYLKAFNAVDISTRDFLRSSLNIFLHRPFGILLFFDFLYCVSRPSDSL